MKNNSKPRVCRICQFWNIDYPLPGEWSENCLKHANKKPCDAACADFKLDERCPWIDLHEYCTEICLNDCTDNLLDKNKSLDK